MSNASSSSKRRHAALRHEQGELGQWQGCMAGQEQEPQEEYIMIVDADNIMRFPFDPVQLRVEPGGTLSGQFHVCAEALHVTYPVTVILICILFILQHAVLA